MSGMQLPTELQAASLAPLSIAFAFVATHNHFVLDRGEGIQAVRAGIKLPEGATEDEHLAAARGAELVDGVLLAQTE